MSDNIELGDSSTVCPESTEQITTIIIPAKNKTLSSSSFSMSSSSITSMEVAFDSEFPEEKAECRFCQEEDLLSHLESPCACSGTLKYAHRSCIHRWCNSKGNIICEICKQSYVPDYVVSESRSEPRSSDETAIDIRDRWPIERNFATQFQSSLLRVERNDDHLTTIITQEYCVLSNSTRGIFCGVILILFLALLIFRDVYYYNHSTTKDDKDKATQTAFSIIMIIMAPLCLLTCLYECKAYLLNGERGEQRDRTA